MNENMCQIKNDSFIKMEGANNFRDIGLYSCVGGYSLRQGLIYRSDRLSGLTDADQRILHGLSLKAIFDLRARREREADPTCWTAPGVETHTFRPGHKRRLVDMAQDYPATRPGAEALMLDFYAGLPRAMSHVFGEILLRISEGAFPCIIHCSAGKDRTGMAVALLLAALGCNRQTIIADYALSANARSLQGAMVRSVAKDEGTGSFAARYPAEALAELTAARPAYLEAALAAIDRDHGSMADYLAGIGIDEPVIARLRAHLLQPI